MDYTSFGLALGVIALATLVLGHGLLFGLLHFGARVPRSLAIRLADTGGLALGYALAAFVIPRTSGAVICWGGAPLLPGVLIAGLSVAALLAIWLLPPGPAGVDA